MNGSKGNGGRRHAATEGGGPDAVSHGWSRLVAPSHGVLRKKRLFIFCSLKGDEAVLHDVLTDVRALNSG